MGRRKPKTRNPEDVAVLAAAWATVGERPGYRCVAVPPRLERHDSGAVLLPLTWTVAISVVTEDGFPVDGDFIVRVADATGGVRLHPLCAGS